MRLYLSVSLLITLLMPCILLSQRGTFVKIPASANYIKGEIILKVKPEYRGKLTQNSIGLPSVLLAAPNLKLQKVEQLYPNHEVPANARSRAGEKLIDLSTIYSLKFDPKISVEDAINALWTEDAYEFMEPRYINTPFFTPNDPTLANLDANAYTLINAYTAWDLAIGTHSVVCGVVDTGYKFGLAEMDGNLVTTPGEIAGNGIDDDANGYIDDVYGWDFADNDNTVVGTVANPHGYLVASRFVPVMNNSTLYPGLFYNCGFRPVKVAPSEASITHGYEGIIYAADNGMQVINCSWGSSNYTVYGETVVNYATINKNAAVVVAAGNTQSDIRYYPAAFRRSISVGACSGTGVVNTTFSSYNYTMDINSPNKGGYTSNAAPVVTGAVALTYSRYHYTLGQAAFTPYQAAQRVRVKAVNNYALNPAYMADRLGLGRVDLFNAVNNVSTSPAVRITNESLTTLIGDGDNEIESGETFQVNLDFINWLDPTGNLTITISPDAGCAPYITMITGVQNPGVMGMLGTGSHIFSFSVSPGTPTDLPINLKVAYTDPITGYTDFEYCLLEGNPNILNVTNNLLHLSVTGKGNLGYRDYPYNGSGIGIQYNGMLSALYEGGFLIGNSGTSIANNIRSNSSTADQDFVPISRIAQNPAPIGSDYAANAAFTDATAPVPLGLSINMNVYNYNSAPSQDYLIVEYLITNTTGSAINGLYSGLFMDWDIYSNPADPNAYAKNVCNYDEAKKMIYARQDLYSDYYAVALLTDEGFTTRAYTSAATNFTDVGKFAAITNTPTAASASVTTPSDIMQFIGTGSWSIPAGNTHRIAFAIIGGNSLAALDASRLNAIKNYFGQIVGGVPANTVGGSTLNADMEEGDAEGWTYYYRTAGQNRLLLALKKDNTMSVTPAQVTVGFGGNPYYTQITAPIAPYATNYPTGWYVMNRYWNVSPTVQPASPVGVRFYYTAADFAALQTNCPSLVTDTDLQFFKFTSASGINPYPGLGHAGAVYSDLIGINPTIEVLGNHHFGQFTVGSFSGGGIGETGDGASFPVQWLDFEARLLDNKTVKLYWGTASETLNDYFTVEKSVDGVSFSPIQTVDAGNYSHQAQYYNAVDLAPTWGINYYRIMQTDIDGKNTYSTTQTLTFSEKQPVQFVIAPNPASNQLTITPIGKQDGYQYTMMNVLGEKVRENQNVVKETTVDLSGLSKGLYYLILSGEGFSQKQSVWVK